MDKSKYKMEIITLTEKMIAVAINMKIIHKKDYDKTIIMEEDRIEIVKPVGGG